jgi:acetaldehyde dehydrogenase (acetylating)
MNKDLESIQEARDLAEKAYSAYQSFEHFTAEQVERILAEISRVAIANATALAKIAVEETGYGNVEHKTLKNLFCARDVYNAIKPMKTVGIVSEDPERKVFEVASPIGVIAAIIPSTNPTSTAIYKALIALKGRNTIVFSPHPSAARCINETSRLMAEAAETAGAPKGVISCMKASTIEGAEALMKHQRTSLILATGGTGLVKAAYSAGKPAFGVGPGNVPSYIESTADVPRAVRDILTGKTFDNGTLCSSEQSIICDEAVKDTALEQLRAQGAYICNAAEKAKLESIIRTPRGTLNTKIVGQSAEKIAHMAGFSVPAGTRAIVAHADGVGPAFPISMEKLSPLLAFYVVKDWQEGCAKCIEVLSFGGLGHTLSLHTREDRIVREFGLKKPAFRICVNTPAALGAVGYTTNLFPSMTLGCGAQGNNITSDNISPLHLINLKRVAYGVRDVEAPPPAKRSVIEKVVDQWLEKDSRRGGTRGPLGEPPKAVYRSDPEGGPDAKKTEQPGQQPAPPLSSFKELQPAPSKPVAFVCEEDVRAAIDARSHIVLGRKTIVTPLARELGEAHDIFVTAD